MSLPSVQGRLPNSSDPLVAAPSVAQVYRCEVRPDSGGCSFQASPGPSAVLRSAQMVGIHHSTSGERVRWELGVGAAASCQREPAQLAALSRGTRQLLGQLVVRFTRILYLHILAGPYAAEIRDGTLQARTATIFMPPSMLCPQQYPTTPNVLQVTADSVLQRHAKERMGLDA